MTQIESSCRHIPPKCLLLTALDKLRLIPERSLEVKQAPGLAMSRAVRLVLAQWILLLAGKQRSSDAPVLARQACAFNGPCPNDDDPMLWNF